MHPGDKEDVVSIGRVKSAVPDGPPDQPQGQKCVETRLDAFPPLLPSVPPSRLLPAPSNPQPLTVTSSSSSSSSSSSRP
ncbi:hypothetical protein SprV_0100358000 [Sparganum proliferum]